jgi:sugar phosphate isomerase/epimerase
VIAAQLYTVRDRLQDRAALAHVLGRLSQIGYDAVEVAGLGREAAERFEEDLNHSGLIACAAHESFEALQQDPGSLAARCLAWGCRYVVVPSLPATYRSAAGVDRFAAEAAELAEKLGAYGLRLAYHNHSFELERWAGRTGLERLFEQTPPEVLNAELDTYWLQHGGASPSAWIRKLAGRVPLVHLKDMAVVGGEVVQSEIGEGNLDWPGILSACQGAGTEWLVIEQDECARDPLDSLAISYRNLTHLMGAAVDQRS